MKKPLLYLFLVFTITACQKEIEFIKLYNSITPNGYNMTFGGEGGIPNDDVKKKISISFIN